MMTAEEWEAKMGRPPVNDDLERVNCPCEGKLGHWGCGWCEEHQLPKWGCGCGIPRANGGVND